MQSSHITEENVSAVQEEQKGESMHNCESMAVNCTVLEEAKNCEPEMEENCKQTLVENCVHETEDIFDSEIVQYCEPELAENCEPELTENCGPELAENCEPEISEEDCDFNLTENFEPEIQIEENCDFGGVGKSQPESVGNFEIENAVDSRQDKEGKSVLETGDVNEELIVEPEQVFIKEEINESDNDENLNNHDKITENGGQRPIFVTLEKDNFPCDVCEESFSKSGFLKRHKLMHHNDSSQEQPYHEKNVQCEICEKWLTSKKSLKVHLSVIHLGNILKLFCSY